MGRCGDSVRNRTHGLTSATMLTNHYAKRANAQLGWFFVGSADSSRQQTGCEMMEAYSLSSCSALSQPARRLSSRLISTFPTWRAMAIP